MSLDPPNEWAVEGLILRPGEYEQRNTAYVLAHCPDMVEDYTGKEVILPKWSGIPFSWRGLSCHRISELDILGTIVEVSQAHPLGLQLNPGLVMFMKGRVNTLRGGRIIAPDIARDTPYFTPSFGRVVLTAGHLNSEIEVGDTIVLPHREVGTPFRGYFICPETEVLAVIDQDTEAQGART